MNQFSDIVSGSNAFYSRVSGEISRRFFLILSLSQFRISAERRVLLCFLFKLLYEKSLPDV